MPATVMVSGSCSGRLLWSALRSTSHWLWWNQGSFSHTLFHYCSLQPWRVSFHCVPSPHWEYASNGSVENILWGVSFRRFPGLGSQGLRYGHLVVFLIAEPYTPSPSWATDAAQCVRLLPSVMVGKALKYSHVPGDFQHAFQSFLATEYGGSNSAA